MQHEPRQRRSYAFYDVAVSVCTTCLVRCEAKLVVVDDCVFMDKWCPEHGRERVLVADDVDYWRACREGPLRRSEMPLHPQTPMRHGCPYDCGLCPDHQQHSCITVVDLTDHCNLRCPMCYASSGPERTGYRSLAEVEAMLDGVVRSEGQPDVVQLSGGEPTLHPELFAIIDAARDRPIRHLMLNTNGIRLAKEPDLAKRLAGYLPGFEVYLQFDSLRPEVHRTLRGADLLDTKLRALENLEQAGLSTTLVATLQRGCNEDEIGALIEFALKWRCVRGVTLQPVQVAGRTDCYDPETRRLTLTEVRRRIAEQSDVFALDDLVPVPCHPDCLVMGYALKTPTGVHPLTRYVDPTALVDGSENTVLFEQLPGVREATRGLFSAGEGPSDQATRLGQLLCCLPGVEARGLTYENVFRVMVVRFLDARDFDVRSVKRSCIHFAQPDGKLIPFDTYNLFYRGSLRARLDQLRGAVGRKP